jgi:hypothetical protein
MSLFVVSKDAIRATTLSPVSRCIKPTLTVLAERASTYTVKTPGCLVNASGSDFEQKDS